METATENINLSNSQSPSDSDDKNSETIDSNDTSSTTSDDNELSKDTPVDTNISGNKRINSNTLDTNVLKEKQSTSTYDIYTKNDVIRIAAKADSPLIDKRDEYSPSSKFRSDLQKNKFI